MDPQTRSVEFAILFTIYFFSSFLFLIPHSYFFQLSCIYTELFIPEEEEVQFVYC